MLARVSTLAPGDPSHLVDLGDRYFQQGDKKKALEIWGRIKTVVPNRAKALATLGEVYLDHDMSAEGVDALREACQLDPQNVPFKKDYAVALERTATATGPSAAAGARLEEARRSGTDHQANKNDRTRPRGPLAHRHALQPVRIEQQVSRSSAVSARPPDLPGRLLADANEACTGCRIGEHAVALRPSRPGDADSSFARAGAGLRKT